jgi:hypothetical protein
VPFAAPDEEPELDPVFAAGAEPDEELVASVPVAAPPFEVVEEPLDDAGGAVEDPALEPHAGVEVDELALDELGDAPPADGEVVPLGVLLLLELLVVEEVEVEVAAPVEPEEPAAVQLPVTGALAGALLVAMTG